MCDRMIDVWKSRVLAVSSDICNDGVKFHFASFYLDELDNAANGELNAEQILYFLKPYIELLPQKIRFVAHKKYFVLYYVQGGAQLPFEK